MTDRPAMLLSASFPAGPRGDKFPPSDPAALADAVTAIARAVLDRGVLIVCGGHPTITPLLLYVAAEHGARDSTIVFQTESKRDVVPDETWRLEREGWGHLQFTAATGDEDEDLAIMRAEMVRAVPLRGAVFIGGMEGIDREYDLVGELKPRVPRFPLRAPGGAAARLEPDPYASGVDLRSPRYAVVALELARQLTR